MTTSLIPDPNFKLIAGGHSRCVIIFSSFALKAHPGGFSFLKEMSPHADLADFLFIKDPSNQWFNREIPGIGSGVAEIGDWIANAVKDYTEVVTFGTSMGGYASLVYAPRVRAKHAIAISPQTFLAAPFPRFNRSIHRGAYVDIGKSFEADKVGTVDIIVGEHDLFDIYQMNELSDAPNVRKSIVPNSFHNVAYHWHRLGRLAEILQTIPQGDWESRVSALRDSYRTQTPLYGQNERRVFRATVKKAIEGRYRNHLENCLVGLDALVNALPSWLGALNVLGQVKCANGALGPGVELLQQVRMQNKYIDDLYRPLARALASLGHLDEAFAVVDEGTTVNAANLVGFQELRAIYMAFGRQDLVLACNARLSPTGAQ